MRPLLNNIVLALAWSALSGEISAHNFTVGFVLGYIILGLQQQVSGESSYFRKGTQFVDVFGRFMVSLVLAGIEVALDVVTPRHRAQPGIVAVPVDVETEMEILILATRISLTPGTFLLDISPDHKTFYIHVMFMKDADQVREDIRENIERPLLELMR